ncbi:hypothetical protein PI739_02880 [Pseudomonas cerasi]|uniref:hypothetical protein n=1 Tax=Pseudomonas cerasi TaxID=1583341 RepID=UPI0023004572|nr:hypothetical protein [Pseudomonas cerasi]MDA7011295.1 hypothetical protein [Pseudomonas cerasi]
MFAKFLETVSATFMLTAAAYAAGVVQSKELFRELGVEPELVSIEVQKALYDGGLLIFAELSRDFWKLIPYFAGVAALCLIVLRIRRVREWLTTHGIIIVRCLSIFFYALFLWVIYDVSVSAFAKGRTLGAEFAIHLKKECTSTTVKYEGGASAGLCAIGRTSDLLWFYDPKSHNSVAFGKDKVIRLTTGN